MNARAARHLFGSLMLCLVLISTGVNAQISAARRLPVVYPADAVLTVTPDRPDWTYAPGATAQVRIHFNVHPYPAAGVPIRYQLGPEMREGAQIDAIVPQQGLVLAVPAPAQPGFMRCIVDATIDAKPVRESATLAFAPEQIAASQTNPADFDTFWAQQKAALEMVAPDFQLTAAPELSNARVEVSYLSFQNVGNGAGHSRFYGVLAVPRGAGPFPALLNVPGAGVRAYKGNLALAEQGFITLQVGVHGIPVNLPDEVYAQLERGALNHYNRFNLDDRYNYYYRRVYLGALRASDYLTGLPKWDRKNLVVSGSSQGGQLSIVTAVLNPRVTAVAASYPAYSDVSAYLHGRTGGWPGLFKPGADGKRSDEPVEAKLRTTGYYDTVNFARRLKVPGHYFFGFNDDVTPPSSTFATYNAITAPKQLLLAPEQRHKTSSEQGAIIAAWIVRQGGLAP